MGPLPPVTRALLIICVLVFVLQNMAGAEDWLLIHMALWPTLFNDANLPVALGGYPEFRPWQLLTYGFMHGSPSHLLFNGFALWMFGGSLEKFWGARPYLTYVLVAIVGAGMVQWLVGTLGGQPYPTVGISGGVFGVLLGFGMMFPNRQLMLLIPPIPMKARTLVVVYALFELYMGVFTSGGGVAHFAHLGGLATGWLMILYWRGSLPFKPKRILRY